MKKITTMIAASALLAACGSADAGGGQAAARPKVDAKPLTISGVGIGMSAENAKAVLAREGWKVTTFPGRDWTTTVAEERDRQRSAPMVERPRSGIETMEARKGDESLIVDLRPTPAGAEVRFVKYEAPMDGRTSSEVGGQLVQRYGPASIASASGGPLEMTWCSGGERCRSALGSLKPALGAKEDVYHKLRLSLSGGSAADQAWQEGLRRAAGGGAAKSSF